MRVDTRRPSQVANREPPEMAGWPAAVGRKAAGERISLATRTLRGQSLRPHEDDGRAADSINSQVGQPGQVRGGFQAAKGRPVGQTNKQCNEMSRPRNEWPPVSPDWAAPAT